MGLLSWRRWRRAPKRIAETVKAISCLHNWWDTVLRYTGLRKYEAGFEVVTRKGIRIRTSQAAELVTVWTVWIRGEYSVPKGLPTVVDVGANIGSFSILAAMRGASRVVAIEPASKTFAKLKANIELNHLEPVVQTVRAAIGGKSGRRTLFISDNSPMTSFYCACVHGIEREETETLGLWDLCKNLQIQTINLLKLDCEGAEYEIVESCRRELLARIERIILEYHANGDYKKLTNILKEAGFEIRRHISTGHRTGVIEFLRQGICWDPNT